MRKLAIAAAVIAAGLSAPSYAAITVYTSQASFLAAVGTAGVDTFAGFSTTGSTPSPIVRTAGAYGYTGSVSTTSFFGAGTAANPWLSTNTATDTMTFNAFTGGTIAGFGGNFFGSDITGAFAAGNITLTATDASGTTTYTLVAPTTASFIGFVSTTGILSATVASVQPTSGFLWPTVDNLTLAAPRAVTPGVPEPATWAMMIVGFGLVGGAMRRRAVSARVTYA